MTIRTPARAAAVLVVGALLAGPAGAVEPPLAGTWVETGPRTTFHFEPCGPATCATLVDSIYIQADADARDVKNPDPALRDRRLKGLTIFRDLTPSAMGWSGAIYIPSMGRTFAMTLRRIGPRQIDFSVCLAPQDCHDATLTPKAP